MSSIAPEHSNHELSFATTHNAHLLKDKKLHFNRQTGRVVMKGNVNTYFEKQLAQEALRNIDGVREIENELVVAWA